MKAEEAVCFAEAASCLKHSVEGDMNLVTEGEVYALMHSSSPASYVDRKAFIA